MKWEESYLGRLRNAMGNQKIINVSVRGIIQDGENRVLLVRRRDNGKWVMPAGSLEINESVLDGLKREIKEETGIEVEEAELIAIYSDPKYSYVSWGFEYQMLALVFHVTKWSGILKEQTDETLDARFFDLEQLSLLNLPELYMETIEDLKKFKRSGKVILK
ncbi:NUDIX domain-containing protein [Caldanaerobius fijiensis]|nr:NUDIX domain-containing protein [Caldanaerobius fijiensis]